MQQHLDEVRGSQQQHIQVSLCLQRLSAGRRISHDALLLCCQGKKLHLDGLLVGLRQGSSEDALKTSLDQTVCYLQDVKDRCDFILGGET